MSISLLREEGKKTYFFTLLGPEVWWFMEDFNKSDLCDFKLDWFESRVDFKSVETYLKHWKKMYFHAYCLLFPASVRGFLLLSLLFPLNPNDAVPLCCTTRPLWIVSAANPFSHPFIQLGIITRVRSRQARIQAAVPSALLNAVIPRRRYRISVSRNNGRLVGPSICASQPWRGPYSDWRRFSPILTASARN